MSDLGWRTTRRWILLGFDRLLLLFGWFSLLAAAFLLSMSLLWHSTLSPFQHPGVSPGAGQLLLVTAEAIRWAFTAGAGVATAMLRGPAWRKRMKEAFFIAWMMRPVVALVGTIAMMAVTAVLWFIWIGRLPGGDRFGNGLLAGLYFLLPLAQLAVTAAYLADDPDGRDPFTPSKPKGSTLPPRSAGLRRPARKKTG